MTPIETQTIKHFFQNRVKHSHKFIPTFDKLHVHSLRVISTKHLYRSLINTVIDFVFYICNSHIIRDQNFTRIFSHLNALFYELSRFQYVFQEPDKIRGHLNATSWLKINEKCRLNESPVLISNTQFCQFFPDSKKSYVEREL